MSVSAPVHADALHSIQCGTSASALVQVDETHSPRSREFDHIEARLIARFSPVLGTAEVRRCLTDCIERYESAPVRQFLPLLIERDATHHLRNLSRAAAPQRSDRGMT